MMCWLVTRPCCRPITIQQTPCMMQSDLLANSSLPTNWILKHLIIRLRHVFSLLLVYLLYPKMYHSIFSIKWCSIPYVFLIKILTSWRHFRHWNWCAQWKETVAVWSHIQSVGGWLVKQILFWLMNGKYRRTTSKRYNEEWCSRNLYTFSIMRGKEQSRKVLDGTVYM